MEYDEPVYSGVLLVPSAGKILLKKTWQQKFCLLFKASKFAIERLEIYDTTDTKKGAPFRILTLENCIKITSNSPTHFSIITKSTPSINEFDAISLESKQEWLTALQTVAFPDDTSKITSIEEDNDLYCSSGEGIFTVKIHSSPASKRCGLNDKKYMLVLTSNAIHLRNLSDNSLVYTWPYCFIRRYGYKSGKFTFEAGRKCESGEGTFFLEHQNQQEIFRCLASKMKSMKQLLKSDPSSTTSIPDFGDNQFHAALNMEARSRSPLPPSPTTSTSLHDIDSNLSNKSFSESIESIGLNRTKPKIKPNKPPRKYLQTIKQIENNNLKMISSNYEIIDKYDDVEYRKNAWRTLGIDEINHTENLEGNEEDEEYMSWGEVKKTQIQQPISTNKAPKVIQTQPSVSNLADDYDQLNFFGSSSKLNVKSGYKQVSPAPVLPIPTPPSFNDYDEVQPALEGFRLADDSHLGYALVRKETVKEDLSINHQFHNNEPYAVISKPKRV